LRQRRCHLDRRSGQQGGLVVRVRRDHDRGGIDGVHEREHAGHAPDGAVEAELADEAHPLDRSRRHIARRDEKTDGDREVETRADLAQAGRRQVHRDPLVRPPQPGTDEGRPHTVAGLAAGRVGQPDEREARDADGHVHLDGDGMTVHPEQRGRRNARQHDSLLTGSTNVRWAVPRRPTSAVCRLTGPYDSLRQRPWKRGSRFSTNAVIASAVSLDEKFTFCTTASASRACASDIAIELFSSFLLMLSVFGGPAANRRAQSSTKASSSDAGTTRLTRPISIASFAPMMSANSTSSFALCKPMRRGNTQDPPKSIESPRLAKISEKRASSLATIKSHPSARLSPAPAATPPTFAITGCGSACN